MPRRATALGDRKGSPLLFGAGLPALHRVALDD